MTKEAGVVMYLTLGDMVFGVLCSAWKPLTLEIFHLSFVISAVCAVNCTGSVDSEFWDRVTETTKYEFTFCLRNKGRKEMFYLTTHSTHCIYGYMASDIW